MQTTLHKAGVFLSLLPLHIPESHNGDSGDIEQSFSSDNHLDETEYEKKALKGAGGNPSALGA